LWSRRVAIVAALTVFIAVGAGAAAFFTRADPKLARADWADAAQVGQGRAVYAAQCATCHGANLEGQPNWRQRQPNGRLPAPPHDASGHTWHHPDRVLFEITREGIAAHAPAGYESDMPAFGGTLSDPEIWAVLAYIKSTWPVDIRERQDGLSQRASEK
jgi:mono/diheme cytochrome c family protein